jgi:hypothetical protein
MRRVRFGQAYTVMAKKIQLGLGILALSAAVKLAAFESFTLYFDVPNISTVDPTGQPTFPLAGNPPYTIQNSGTYTFGSWNTTTGFSTVGLGAAGLQIPSLTDAFALKGLSLNNVTSPLAASSISMQTRTRIAYTFQNTVNVDQTGTATVRGNISAYQLGTSTVPADPLTTGAIMQVNNPLIIGPVTLTANDSLPGGTDQLAGVNDVNGSTSYNLTAGQITTLNSTGQQMPVKFFGTASFSGSGNVGVTAQTFGYAVIAVTYTYVPEASTWAAGAMLGLTGVAFAARRRMSSQA